MKKSHPKRQRIPRRGPGVAELEKILKEQQAQDSDTQFQDISPPSPPPPLPSPVPFLPPRDYTSWSNNLPLFPTLDLIPPALPTAADAAGKPVFPTTPKSHTQMNIPPHFFPNFQYYNSMVNFTPGSASSSPSATSSAARYFHQILEHPSSQRSTDFNHIWTSPEQQEQMVSGKRARSFLDEHPSRRIPNFSNIMAVKESSSSSSSSSSFEINRSTAINFDSNFRDQTKRGFSGQLMSSTKSSGSYQLADQDSSNLMALAGSSSTPNQFAPFDHFQETMEASQQRDEGGSASDYNKITFKSSLYESNSKLKGGIVATIDSEAEATAEAEDEEGDGIDLDLKL